MSEWETLLGETPIDPSGLKNRGLIKNRRELAAAEALNINRAFMKYLAARPSSRSAPLDYEWFLKLHEEMFGDVWIWAGGLRRHDVNIGVPHYQLTEQLAALASDLHSWSDYGHTLEMQATWLHRRAVEIHPFENGNGRWARLLSNVWLKLHGKPIVAWPDKLLGEVSEIRDEYLAAIRAADAGDHVPLSELHRRFEETPESRHPGSP